MAKIKVKIIGKKAKPSKPSRPSFVTIASRTKADLKQLTQAGIDQRAASQILISPDEVAGDYDAARGLLTSMGGVLRPITIEDLKTFRANVRALGSRFKGGITAKQVIDLSMPAPRVKAHNEIRMAVPTMQKGGRITFQTNAGPNSRSQRHIVTVEFMMFEACAASPVEPSKIVSQLLKGKIKLDCDCEDWRYRLRYIATTGKYAAGPWFENSFPKETNPMLHGVGCKHVLRVCTNIMQSPTFKTYAIKMIEKAREGVARKEEINKIKDIEAYLEKTKKESWRQRSVRTTEQKRGLKQAVAMRLKAEQRAHDKAVAKAKKDRDAFINKTTRNAKQMLSDGVITQSMYDEIIKNAQNVAKG